MKPNPINQLPLSANAVKLQYGMKPGFFKPSTFYACYRLYDFGNTKIITNHSVQHGSNKLGSLG